MSAGIYISVPFCRQKCTYCNFASGVHAAPLLPRYMECLIAEITNHNELWNAAGIVSASSDEDVILSEAKDLLFSSGDNHLPVDSIYFGGGTPGMLEPAQLSRILDAVRSAFLVDPQCETTIEASPENVAPEAALA